MRAAGFPTTSVPFGYESVYDPGLRRKVWRTTPEAETVKVIFKEFLLNPDEPLSSLAKQNNVSRQLLRKILRNRCYIGGFRWKGEFIRADPSVIPAIVSEEDFGNVQVLLQDQIGEIGEREVYLYIVHREPVPQQDINKFGMGRKKVMPIVDSLLAKGMIKLAANVVHPKSKWYVSAD